MKTALASPRAPQVRVVDHADPANDPDRTAADFDTARAGPFEGVSARIVFAITDWSPERRTLGPFRDTFHPVP